MDGNNIIDELKKEVASLREENEALKEKLKKYTAPTRSKSYYQNHREEILLKKKEAQKNSNIDDKEKRKEINKQAYLKRKEKKEKVIADII